MYKRLIALLLSLLLALPLAGCGKKEPTDTRPQVVCTSFSAYDFVRQIVGERMAVSLLLAPGQECHTYEPSPKDVLRIRSAALFCTVGGESEAWVEDILQSMGDDAPRTLAMMECVDPVKEKLTEGMEGTTEGDYDEHVWTSPKNAVKIVERLVGVLCEIDGANIDLYRLSAMGYIGQLEDLDERIRDTVEAGARRTLVFADRFPFRYFADEYGLTCFAPYPGCAHSAEPSAATVAFLADKVKSEHIPVVLTIEFSNEKIADTLVEATGAGKRLFHSCHNVSADELAAGATYLSLMEQNLAVLKEALSA